MALDQFASKLTRSADESERALRIVAAEAPASRVPATFKGITSGYECKYGKQFAVRLNTGEWVKA